MALDAGVVGRHGIHRGGITNVSACGMRHVLAARAMTALTAYVPLGNLFAVDVVADRMATVAGWSGRALHVVCGIERRPPVPTGRRNHIRTPLAFPDDPLRRQREIIIANPGEIALLPETAVDERHLAPGEL